MNYIFDNGHYIGPTDHASSPTSVTLSATNQPNTTAEMRIPIENEGILERDEFFNITLYTGETRVLITNSTSVIIVNDDGEP